MQQSKIFAVRVLNSFLEKISIPMAWKWIAFLPRHLHSLAWHTSHSSFPFSFQSLRLNLLAQCLDQDRRIGLKTLDIEMWAPGTHAWDVLNRPLKASNPDFESLSIRSGGEESISLLPIDLRYSSIAQQDLPIRSLHSVRIWRCSLTRFFYTSLILPDFV